MTCYSTIFCMRTVLLMKSKCNSLLFLFLFLRFRLTGKLYGKNEKNVTSLKCHLCSISNPYESFRALLLLIHKNRHKKINPHTHCKKTIMSRDDDCSAASLPSVRNLLKTTWQFRELTL